MSAEQATEATSSVAGYVEALTGEAALGWAWSPGRAERLRVELRLGEQTVAGGVADALRDDLARSGIGDGRHAFSLQVPEALRSRARELRVVALDADGTETPLGPPPVADPVLARLLHLQRAMEVMASSQRLIHRNLQAALLQRAPPAGPALAEVAAAQASLQESIGTLELLAIRLQQALGARDEASDPAGRPRLLAAVAGVSGLALVAACAALARTLLG